MLRGFHHSSFTVGDMDRSLAFYRDLLGLTVLADMWPDADYPAQVIQYQTQAGEPLPLATNRPGCAHVCFLVDDLPAVHARLRGQGVRFVSPPVAITQGVNQGGYAVYLRDPDGITIELLQPPD